MTSSLISPASVWMMSQAVGVAVRVMEEAGLCMKVRVWFRFVGVSSALLTLHRPASPVDIASVGVANNACGLAAGTSH